MKSLLRQSLISKTTLLSSVGHNHQFMTSLTTTRRQSTQLMTSSAQDSDSDTNEDNSEIVMKVVETEMKRRFEGTTNQLKYSLSKPSVVSLVKTLNVKKWQKHVTEGLIDITIDPIETLLRSDYFTEKTVDHYLNVEFITCPSHTLGSSVVQLGEPHINSTVTNKSFESPLIKRFGRVIKNMKNNEIREDNVMIFVNMVTDYLNYDTNDNIILDTKRPIKVYFGEEPETAIPDLTIFDNSNKGNRFLDKPIVCTYELKSVVNSSDSYDRHRAQAVGTAIMAGAYNFHTFDSLDPIFCVLIRSKWFHFFEIKITKKYTKRLLSNDLTKADKVIVKQLNYGNPFDFEDENHKQIIYQLLLSINSFKQLYHNRDDI
ncbi:uncharacterized protein LOC128957987 [Oppia nitens]|uniref:uncharacterized protein LOC128957987 n=1 Tax=Oppia nitens TaxID=1686743 RepID=UPI0023DC6F51|nr:uncharacterized protein LOC128957987 [Oppia nitens]